MRFLRVDFEGELRSVDLHPFLNVVSGLSRHHQRRLFDTIRWLASGRTQGIRGLVEHQGILLELDGNHQAGLNEAATKADVVVYADIGPGETPLLTFEDEIDFWRRRAAVDAARVEEIRADLDVVAKSDVVEIRQHLARTSPAKMLNEPDDRSAVVEAVRSCYFRVSKLPPINVHTDEQVVELIQRWKDLCVVRDRVEQDLSTSRLAVSEAEKEVARADAALAAANADAKPVRLTKEQEMRLEELCDPEHSSNKKRNKDSSAADDEERKALLRIVGVSSWPAYTLSRLTPRIPEEKKTAVRDAERAHGLAEKNLAAANHHVNSSEEASGLTAQLADLRQDCQPFLGVLIPKDIGAALEKLTSESPNPEWEHEVDGLAAVISEHNLQANEEGTADRTSTVAWAKSWLESLDLVAEDSQDKLEPADRQKTRAKLEQAEERLLRHRRAVARLGPAEEMTTYSAERQARLEHVLEQRAGLSCPSSAAEVVKQLMSIVDLESGSRAPLVIVGSFEGLDADEVERLMGALQGLSALRQVIVVTDRLQVASQALSFGMERAAVTDGLKALV